MSTIGGVSGHLLYRIVNAASGKTCGRAKAMQAIIWITKTWSGYFSAKAFNPSPNNIFQPPSALLADFAVTLPMSASETFKTPP